jgi:hypothetical protein
VTTEYEFMEVEVGFRIFGEDLDPDCDQRAGHDRTRRSGRVKSET